MPNNILIAVCRNLDNAHSLLKLTQSQQLAANGVSFIKKEQCSEEFPVGIFLENANMCDFIGEGKGFWDNVRAHGNSFAVMSMADKGPLVLCGPLVGWMLNTITNHQVGRGITAFSSTLIQLGIEEEKVFLLSAELRSFKPMALVRGTTSELEKLSEDLAESVESAVIFENLNFSFRK